MDLKDEDNEPNDTYGEESVLAMERIMRETNVKPLNLDIADNLHGMLIREAKAEALRRYEKAAQSPDVNRSPSRGQRKNIKFFSQPGQVCRAVATEDLGSLLRRQPESSVFIRRRDKPYASP